MKSQKLAIVMAVIVFTLLAVFAPKEKEPISSNVDAVKQEQVKMKQEEVDKNLENFMELGSQSGMIKDAKAGVIYVSDNWFLWSVNQKEDFITLSSKVLKEASGFEDIKIKHYLSNKLLGEFTWGKSQVYN